MQGVPTETTFRLSMSDKDWEIIDTALTAYSHNAVYRDLRDKLDMQVAMVRALGQASRPRQRIREPDALAPGHRAGLAHVTVDGDRGPQQRGNEEHIAAPHLNVVQGIAPEGLGEADGQGRSIAHQLARLQVAVVDQLRRALLHTAAHASGPREQLGDVRRETQRVEAWLLDCSHHTRLVPRRLHDRE